MVLINNSTPHPISQTFYVGDNSGAAGVFITKIDIFFQKISTVFGIELQIRDVVNGLPTRSILPFGKKFLSVTDVNADSTLSIKASDNGLLPTTFVFDTPVYVKSNQTYSFALLPAANNPDYNVWTSDLGVDPVTNKSYIDIVSKAPITTNNDTGDLFLSTNDLTWVPEITKDIKFNLYTATFTSLTADAYFNTAATEYISFKDVTGRGFIFGERIMFGDVYDSISVLNISSLNGSFSVGQTAYQANGTANATGIVYSSNSSVIKLNNITGLFSNTSGGTQLFNANSVANCNIIGVSQNTSVTASSNTINVPDGSLYTANTQIYVQTTNRSINNIVNITSITNNQLTTNTVFSYSNTNVLIGRMYANNKLSAIVSSVVQDSVNFRASLTGASSNSSVNFSTLSNNQIIGLTSGTAATFRKIENNPYNTVTPTFSAFTPINTDIQMYYNGFNNDAVYSQTSILQVRNNNITELLDQEKVVLSLTNEITQLPGYRSGNNSINIKSSLVSGSPLVSPFIDTIQTDLTYTKNLVANTSLINNGYYLIINDNGINVNNVGDIITQNFATFTINANSAPLTQGLTLTQGSANGIIYQSNSTYLKLVNVNGTFTTGSVGNTTVNCNAIAIINQDVVSGLVLKSNNTISTVINVSNTGSFVSNTYANNTTQNFALSLNSVSPFSETYGNGLAIVSRYITKNILLKAGQDAEDVQVYMSAWRPANTNFNVYIRIKNSADNDLITDKNWSLLKELSSPALLSSSVNTYDSVELQYGFNQSYSLTTSNTSVSNASFVVTVPSTSQLQKGNIVYFEDNSVAKPFNVRKVMNIIDGFTFVIDKPTSFTSANSKFGVIPNINTTTSAFLYDGNYNIVRYSTSNDIIYDSYIQYALKFVPIAQSTSLVPKSRDIIALALQI